MEYTPKDRLLEFQTKTDNTSAELAIIRDQGLAASSCYYAVLIDEKLSARIDVAEKASFYLEPGKHKVKITRDLTGSGLCKDGKDQFEKEVDLTKDEVLKFRLTLELSGQPILNPYKE